jgi:hypothetical protein
MDRMRAYAELAADLEFYRRLPYEELARLVGGPVVERSVESQEGTLTIEARFEWAVAEGGAVRVSASALGPSWWRFDRLEEATTVAPPIRNG